MGEKNEIHAYIEKFPPATQKKLQQLRTLIRKSAPEAEEVISYKMPAYKLNGMLVYFAGYDHHIGFYPTPSAIVSFKKELEAFKYAKGSIQFPLDQSLPTALISQMVKFRVAENLQKKNSRS